MASRVSRLCLVALLGLCGCLAQEPNSAVDTTQARVRELRRLCFESGLDVTGVYDEEELLAEIAQHPKALRALRERIYEQKRAQNGAAQDDDDDDADDLAAMEEEEDSEEEEEEADEEAEDVHSAAQEYAAEDDDEIEEIDLDDEGEEPDKADRAQAGRGSAVGQSAFRAAQKAEQERAQAQAQAQAQQQQQAQRQHQQQQQQQQQQRARAEQPAAARAESDSDELEIAAQLLDSATTRMYLVADADDDLHLSPRDLRDGIVATGQLLLASYGCRLPAGTAVTVKDLTAAIEQIMHVCDTDGDGLLSLPEARAPACRAHLLGYIDNLECEGDPRARLGTAPRKGPVARLLGKPLEALLGAHARFARSTLTTSLAAARDVGTRAAAAIEASSPLGRSLVARLRAVPWATALPQLRTAALWLTIGLTFLLCGTRSPGGDEPFPLFVSGGGGPAGSDGGSDGVWVDDE